MRTFLVLFLFLCGSPAFAWTLYDDFNSPELDLSKWIPSGNMPGDPPLSAAITIKSGMAKFTTTSSHPSGNTTLFFPEEVRKRIKAVKADVIVASADGPVRARIRYTLGSHGEYGMYNQFQLVTVSQNNAYFLSDCYLNKDNIDLVQHEGRHKNLSGYLGTPYTFYLRYNGNGEVIYSSPDSGTTKYTPPFPVDGSTREFRGIGIRKTHSETSAVIYFDNVYVEYEPNLTPVNMLLLNE
jgi:hypothetical protein